MLDPLDVCVGGELMQLVESVAASWAGHADAAVCIDHDCHAWCRWLGGTINSPDEGYDGGLIVGVGSARVPPCSIVEGGMWGGEQC